ncbi:HAD hydrolase family protein [Cellulomonas sp. URHE0023]|uniref:HAD hydrolase family protein n=1 Tax=Cellulomonas sp. URHE0023 TaxID=1380354 RepID=UPI0004851E08|nr:HAD hydrolase family protein [Cellulomonas sp. URHE0023]
MPAGNPLRRKLVFLDIDGTYAERGVVPPGHEVAVRRARAAGHRVFLCTGRSKAMLPSRILDVGFDGVVASAGCYVEVGGNVLADRRFPDDLARRVVSLLIEHDAAFVLEAPEALYGPPGVDDRFRALLGAGGSQEQHGADDFLRVLRMPADLSGVSFAKVTYLAAATAWTELLSSLGPSVGFVPSSIVEAHDFAGELYLADVHKALGIELVQRHLMAERDDVIAFGDGLNDLEMLEYAGVGVAIEGSDDRVLAVADAVARGPHLEGLVASFDDLGLYRRA